MKKTAEKTTFVEYDGNHYRYAGRAGNVEILAGGAWKQFRGDQTKVRTYGMPVDEDEIREAMKAA